MNEVRQWYWSELHRGRCGGAVWDRMMRGGDIIGEPHCLLCVDFCVGCIQCCSVCRRVPVYGALVGIFCVLEV